MQLLEPLYSFELVALEYLQKLPFFSGPILEQFWLVCTKLGDPRWSFFLYFPLFYPLIPKTAIQFLIAAAVSEFVNGDLKWALLGDRPYWYIHEHNAKWKSNEIHLKQFKFTCETGPGSPSGHVMVTASVFYCLTVAARHRGYATMATSFYCILLILVSISRLYIIAHFPHQVFLGLFIGIFVGMLCTKIDPSKWKMKYSLILAAALTFSGFVVFFGLRYFNVDPDWTIEKAYKWCEKREWIHLSTTPMTALIRDIANLIALGLQITVGKETLVWCDNRKYIISFVNLAVIVLIDLIPFPQKNPTLFYCYIFVLNVVRIFVVMIVVPEIFRKIFRGSCKKVK